MKHDEFRQIERLLADVNAGHTSACGQLTDVVYRRLRAVAEHYLRRQFGGEAGSLTWQPTALVNETFLQIIKQRKRYDSEGHFFAIATRVMKRILLDYARQRGAQKRGGGAIKVEFDPNIHGPVHEHSEGALDLETFFTCLDRLAALNTRKADVVRMRVLWGMTIAETAVSLDVGHATIERDWRFAQAWLAREVASRRPKER